MAKSKIEVTTSGLNVTLSCGDVIHIDSKEYGLVDDKMAWVSDRLGLSIDSGTVDSVDCMLYKMIIAPSKIKAS